MHGYDKKARYEQGRRKWYLHNLSLSFKQIWRQEPSSLSGKHYIQIYSSSPKKTLTGSQASPQTLKRSGRESSAFCSSGVNVKSSWKLDSILDAVTLLGMTLVPR